MLVGGLLLLLSCTQFSSSDLPQKLFSPLSLSSENVTNPYRKFPAWQCQGHAECNVEVLHFSADDKVGDPVIELKSMLELCWGSNHAYTGGILTLFFLWTRSGARTCNTCKDIRFWCCALRGLFLDVENCSVLTSLKLWKVFANLFDSCEIDSCEIDFDSCDLSIFGFNIKMSFDQFWLRLSITFQQSLKTQDDVFRLLFFPMNNPYYIPLTIQ